MVNHLLKLVDRDVHLIEKNVVVNGSGGALNSYMRAQIEVEHEWVCHLLLNQSSWQGVAVSVSLFWEKANMMALGGHNHGELWQRLIWSCSFKISLDLFNLLLHDMSKLAFGNTVAEIHDVLGELAIMATHPHFTQVSK